MSLYKIANLIVDMNIKYEPLLSQSSKYEIKKSNKFDLNKFDSNKFDLSHADIVIPNMNEELLKYENKFPHLSIGDCEYMLYGACFYEELLKHNGILLHSSCVVLDGYAYLFSAPSGVGKSTHTQLWLQAFKNARILNDDKPAIIIKNNNVYASGTPFSGKTNLNINEIYPIKGIAFIERSKDNWIKENDIKSSIYAMLNQTIRPNDEIIMENAIDIIEKIVKNVKIYKFGCNISLDAVYTSYNKMKEG